MRVLIANYRYFVSSGPERYMFNISDHLARAGHEVMPFSVRYDQNAPTPYAKYFVGPIAGSGEVFFEDHSNTPQSFYRGMTRLFYSREVEQAIARMAAETKPDVAYVLYYLRKLSPSLLVGLKRQNVPIVVRISDYGMLCPEHHLLRDGAPCTLCLEGNLLNSVRHACVRGSHAISLVDALATTFHRWRGYFNLIDHFVTTNAFMTDMMMRAGFPEEKFTCIPTFANLDLFTPGPAAAGDYFLCVGRLDRPKGVHVLVDAIGRLKARGVTARVKICGGGHMTDYPQALRKQAADLGIADQLEFLGDVPAEKIPALMAGARASIVPAIWFENLPNTLVESFACGCPVIASALGSLAAAIENGVDGLLFRPGDAGDLADKIDLLAKDGGLRDRLSRGARAAALARHAPNDHVAKLVGLFDNVRCAAPAKAG